MRFINRLWIRFSLAIIAIITVVTILPSASLLLITPQDLTGETKGFIQVIDAESNLALTNTQIDKRSKPPV